MSVKERTLSDALQNSWLCMCKEGYQATVGNEVSFTYQNTPVGIYKFKPENFFFPLEKTRAEDADFWAKHGTFASFKEAWKEPMKRVKITFDKWSNEEIIARTAKVYFTINPPTKGQREIEKDWLEGQIVIKEDSIWPFEHKRTQLLDNQT